MAAPLNNHNAKNNKGSITASRDEIKAVKDRLLVFTREQWDRGDEAIRWRIWNKLANNLLPRPVELTGEDGGEVKFLININDNKRN